MSLRFQIYAAGAQDRRRQIKGRAIKAPVARCILIGGVDDR